MNTLDIAVIAIKTYASYKPRPSQVNKAQACEMLDLNIRTLNKLIENGTIKLNKCGLIPIAEIDNALSVEK